MKTPYEIALDEAVKESDNLYEIQKRAAEIYALRFAEWLYENDLSPFPNNIKRLLEQFNQPQP